MDCLHSVLNDVFKFFGVITGILMLFYIFSEENIDLLT